MNRSMFGLLVLAGLPIGMGGVYGMGCANNAEEEKKRQNAAVVEPEPEPVSCGVVDDENPCTIDECVDGETMHRPHPVGTVLADCIGVCNGEGDCVKRPKGDGCKTTAECESGYCTDGVCCDVSSCGKCKSCNVGVNPGECSNVDFMIQDNNCDGDRACNGNGSCEIATGKTCTENDACVGKVCRGTCSNGDSCNDDGDCDPDSCKEKICLVKEGLPCAAETDCFNTTCKCVDAGCTKYTCQKP